jgi:hypothetical protein
MVAEDGRELYAVAAEIQDDPLYTRIGRDRWLMKNVIPHLPLRERDAIKQPDAQYPGRFYLDDTDNRIMPRRMIRNAVREFVLATPDVELWADYGAYDHVALAQLFGRMIDLPQGFPMWTNDLRQEWVRLGRPDLPVQPDGEHHALADARHLKTCAEHLAAVPHAG